MLERFQMIPEDGSSRWRDNADWEPEQEKAAKSTRRNIAGLTSSIIKNEGYQRGRLLRRWFTVLGQGIAVNAYPRYTKKGILYVTCSSPIWSQEILLQQSAILERFNEILPPERHLKKIICKVGNITLPPRFTEPSPALPEAELTPEEQQRVQQLRESFKDKGLGDKVAQAYAQNLIHNRQMEKLGARPCSVCQKLSFHGDPCLECRRRYRAEVRLQVMRRLDEQPWIGFRAMQTLLPHLEMGDYMAFRLALASQWRENIRLEINTIPKDTPLPLDLQVRMIKLVSLEVSKQYADINNGDVLYALHSRYGSALLSKTAPGPPESAPQDKQKRR